MNQYILIGLDWHISVVAYQEL